MFDKIEIKSKICNYSLEFVDSMERIISVMNSKNSITVIDSNVNNLYPQLQRDENIILESLEENKNIQQSEILLSILKDRKANIKTTLVVIGGGILQDLVGFCSSVYCRGIDYILVPTTLLSQADSCIGGKTSINLGDRKNLLGTFYPPKEIIIYPKFIETLSPLDYFSGLGEIYKFYVLQSKIDQFKDSSDLRNMIHEGLSYKIDILSRDEFDRGERKFLNYGHTFGHALESISNYKIPHGLAVVLGCMIASRLSFKEGYMVNNYDEIISKGVDLIRKSNLFIDPSWFNLEVLLEIIKSDKKSTGELTMVLINKNPFLKSIENIQLIEDSLKEVYESI